MNRLRLVDVAPTLARVVNVCQTVSGATNSRITTLVNEAQQRLMNRGKWPGTLTTYRICVGQNACLVWPRQIETIEAWALCTVPGDIRNGWYQFISNGPGILKDSDNWFTTLIDAEPVCSFDDLSDNNNLKKIQVTADVPETTPAPQILLQGYDNNMAWIRTQSGGNWIDGEYVNITNGPISSVNYFSTLTGVQKPATNGPVRLAELDKTLNLVTKQLAYYEADEKTPIYRRSFIPGMTNQQGCNQASGSSCKMSNVTIRAKLRHIPVSNDNDWLLLGNIAALKLMVMAILKEERNLDSESRSYEQRAIEELQQELNSFMGDGELPVLKTEDKDTWGAAALNVIDTNMFIYY